MTRRNNALRRQKPVKNKPKRNKTGPKPIIFDRLDELERITRLFGANNNKIAEYFGVGLSTLEYWIRHYPQVKAARDRGWAEADAKVVDSLYNRARGYSYEEKEYRNVPIRNKKGKIIGWTEKMIRRTTKHIPPETKACMFILSNRHREEWLTRMNVHHSGDVNHTHIKVEELPVEELSPEAQNLLFEITTKQLTNGSRSN